MAICSCIRVQGRGWRRSPEGAPRLPPPGHARSSEARGPASSPARSGGPGPRAVTRGRSGGAPVPPPAFHVRHHRASVAMEPDLSQHCTGKGRGHGVRPRLQKTAGISGCPCGGGSHCPFIIAVITGKVAGSRTRRETGYVLMMRQGSVAKQREN